MRVSRKRTKKPFCIRGVHCRSHEQRGYSNMCLLSLGCQVSCEDCRYPSLAPVIIGWGPCLDWTWEESPVLTSQKTTDFKKHYNFFFGWSPRSCTGFAVGRLSSLSSPLAWCMLWKLDFFFFSEACGFVNETNTVLSQNFFECPVLFQIFLRQFQRCRASELIWIQKLLEGLRKHCLPTKSKERISTWPGSGRVGGYQQGISWWERS